MSNRWTECSDNDIMQLLHRWCIMGQLRENYHFILDNSCKPHSEIIAD